LNQPRKDGGEKEGRVQPKTTIKKGLCGVSQKGEISEPQKGEKPFLAPQIGALRPQAGGRI